MPTSAGEPCACCGRDLEWLGRYDITQRVGLAKSSMWKVDEWLRQEVDPLRSVRLLNRGKHAVVIRSDWLEAWLERRAHPGVDAMTAATLLRTVAPGLWSDLVELARGGREHGLFAEGLDPMRRDDEDDLRSRFLSAFGRVATQVANDRAEDGDERWRHLAYAVARRYQRGTKGYL